MAYLSLYRKYRPQTFEELLGQGHVSETLANAITEDRVAHAYLFTGPRGTGKTSTARILAKALNCEQGPTPNPCGRCESCVAIAKGSSLDVIEMDAASHSKVDETREILAGVPLATAGGRRKVYVIDEVHMLSTQAFNALLKTLEEPPPHVVFILATTEAHKVLQTIVSRTQRFDFRPATSDVLEGHLGRVAKTEGIAIESDALAAIARHADGSFRDALSALEQLASLGTEIASTDVDRMLGEQYEDALIRLFDAVAAGDVGAVFTSLQVQLSQGTDARQLAHAALGHARSLLLVRTAPEAEALLDVAEEDRLRLIAQAESFSPETLLRIVDLLGKSITEMRNASNHRLWLEVALVRAAAPATDPSATGLLGRIERLERRAGIEGAPAAPSEAPPPPPVERSEAPPVERPRAAPPPQPEEPASPVVGPAPSEIGLGHVRDAWTSTMQEVNKRSKTVWALLNPSSPVEFDGQRLVVGVAAEFHEEQMAQDRNRSILADSLHSALGIRPAISFSARKKASQPAPDEVAAPEEETAASIADDDATSAQDPVELVKKGLGGEVVRDRGTS